MKPVLYFPSVQSWNWLGEKESDIETIEQVAVDIGMFDVAGEGDEYDFSFESQLYHYNDSSDDSVTLSILTLSIIPAHIPQHVAVAVKIRDSKGQMIPRKVASEVPFTFDSADEYNRIYYYSYAVMDSMLPIPYFFGLSSDRWERDLYHKVLLSLSNDLQAVSSR